ncbi:MAG: DUF3570 domain-containing protein [Saprospiraceae bacterium]|nr:DUF3570 domain-containing protein [Saprospiraceae bacterium]
MQKLFFTGLALFGLFRVIAQGQDTTSPYKIKTIKIEEINLVSSLYHQEGNNSAVTGGIGTEKLTDVANSLDIKLLFQNDPLKIHTIDLEVGLDHYSSASSDKIDLNANSSASSSDNRFYPSLNYTLENKAKRQTVGVGLSSSTEFDYLSFGGNVSYSKKTKDNAGEFSAKVQVFADQVSLIKPIELRSQGEDGYATAARNTYAATLSYAQIINKNWQILLIADIVKQQGYLSLPFHRVYFDDHSVHQENLPDSRLKLPVAIRSSYFLGDNIIIKAYYRYYTDNWKLSSNTFNIEVPIKLSPFFSLSPFYRFYKQNGAQYFNGFEEHTGTDMFYTSNYDLSDFTSYFAGIGCKFTPLNGVFGIKQFNTLEIRYGHYGKSTGMASNILSLNIKYK